MHTCVGSVIDVVAVVAVVAVVVVVVTNVVIIVKVRRRRYACFLVAWGHVLANTAWADWLAPPRVWDLP